MKKEYEALSVDVVKFEAQDVITLSAPNQEYPNGLPDKNPDALPEVNPSNVAS